MRGNSSCFIADGQNRFAVLTGNPTRILNDCGRHQDTLLDVPVDESRVVNHVQPELARRTPECLMLHTKEMGASGNV
jgi:hypothetical protein